MKLINKLLLLTFFILSAQGLYAQIKVGDNVETVHARSILELESSTKAFYLPRLSNTNLAAYSNWQAGMIVYNTDDSCVQFFNGIVWECVGSGTGVGTEVDGDSTNELQMLSFSGDTLYLSDGNEVYLGGMCVKTDQDSTNEYNIGFGLNGLGDSLIISDKGTRFAVPLTDIIDTTSLSNRIDNKVSVGDTAAMLAPYLKVEDKVTLNNSIDEKLDISDTAAMLAPYLKGEDTVSLSNRINAHILADLDTDPTNEYNTGFTMNGTGDSLIITDAGTRYAVAVGNILDTTSLSNRIDVNLQAIIDSTTNVRGELADTASTLRTVINDSAAVIRTLIENHILADLDTDPTNEYNTGFEMNGTGDSLIITDAGTRYAVAVGSILDTTSLSNRINLNLDSINLNEQGIIDTAGNIRMALTDSADAIRTLIEAHILADLDTDPTNEYNTGFTMNGTGDSLIITDAGTRYAVAVGNILDTTSLSNRIDVNLQAIIDSTTNVRGELADTASTLRTVINDSAAVIRTLIENHILADLDTDPTNEYNTGFTMNGTGDSLIITDAGTRYAVAVGSILDTTSLSNRINLNLDSINLNEQGIIDTAGNIRMALTDSADAIRTLIENHILTDLDTDPTNEYNTGFEMNGTGDSLIITDAGTRYAVAVGSILDTTSLSNRINLNLDSINLNEQGIIDTAGNIRMALTDSADAIRSLIENHILADLDTDPTNEYNTGFEMNGTGDSLIITDAGTRYAVAVGNILDTTSLSNRIDVNLQAIIDSTTNVRGELADTASTLRTVINDSAAVIRTLIENHILADLDTDPTNEYNTGFTMNGTGDSLIITDAGTRYAVAVGSILDTTSLSNRINLNLDSINLNEQGIIDTAGNIRMALTDSADAIRTLIENHILADLDTDPTNEYNTGFTMNGTGDSLIITDAGTRYAVAVGSILDTTSLSNRINLNLDSINLNEQGIIDTAGNIRMALTDSADAIRTLIENHILADLDTDPTNEYNTGFEMNGTGDSLIITDAGTRYAVAVGNILDTTSLSNRIDVNLQAIIDSTTNVRGELADTASTLRTVINDSAAVIRSLIENHILADLDTDSTNEYNTGFEMNGTGDSLVITDAGTRYAVAVKSILDTTSLSNRIDDKLDLSDTATMLALYLQGEDTVSLSARIDEKLNISDTAAMLAPYLEAADTMSLSNRIDDHIAKDKDTSKTNELITAFEVDGTNLKITEAGTDWEVPLNDIIDTTSLSNRIDSKLNISDTAAMLAPYLQGEDTVSLSARIDEKLNISDTAAMLAPYLQGEDTVSLSARIDEKLNISDTAAMLAPYLEAADTMSLSNRIDDHIAKDKDTSKTNELITAFEVDGTNLKITEAGTDWEVPLNDIIDTTSLSNRIDSKLNISDTAAMLAPYLQGEDTVSLSARIDEKLNISDTAAMLAPYLQGEDTVSLSARIDEKLNISDTAAMLAPYLEAADTMSLSNRIDDHIAKDKDTSKTNELITAFEVDGMNLKITEAGTDWEVPLNDIIDTTSLSNRIDSKLNISDTAAMLAPYLQGEDTVSLSARIDEKLNISDTAAMLAPYLQGEDTVSLSARIDEKLNISDTAAMLAPYLEAADTMSLSNRIDNHIAKDKDTSKTNELITAFEVDGTNLKITEAGTDWEVPLNDIIDTTSLSNRIDSKLNISDTAAMLAPYLQGEDTVSLSARIDEKLNISDTAAMLAPYLQGEDTVSLSARIDEKLNISDTAAMLAPYLEAADTMSLSNRIDNHIAKDKDTSKTNELITAFEVDGTNLKITEAGTDWEVPLNDIIDTTSLSNRIDSKLNISDTAAMLAPYLQGEDTVSLSARIDEKLNISDTAAMLAPYLQGADTVSLSARIDEKLNISDTAAMLAPYLEAADTMSLSNRIDDHIAKDKDTSKTNELITAFEVDGMNLKITEAGTDWEVPLNDIIDTTSLSNRIDSKLNISDTAAMLAPYLQGEDTVSLSARIDEKLNISDTAAMLAPYLEAADTMSLSNRIDTHIANDGDLSSTNEIQTLSILGQNITLSSGGGTVLVPTLDTLPLSTRLTNHITADEDVDSTNEIQNLSISNDTLYLSKGNNVYLGEIQGDNDQDSTNELINSVTLSNDSLFISEGDSTFNVKLKYVPTYLCKDENGIVITYRLEEINNRFINEIDTSIRKDYQELLDSGFVTCESGQSSVELTDCKRRERMSDNTSVIVYFNDSADVYTTAGVLTSHSDYDAWFASSGLTVSSILNCFDDVCFQIGNVQYVDNDGDNMFENIDNSADAKSYSTLIGLSAVACTPISCQQVYGPSDFGIDGVSGLPNTDPTCTDLSATWFDAATGELFSWDVTGAVWVSQPSVNTIDCPQGAFTASGTILSSVGVSSITKSGTGRYKVNLSVPQANTDYVVLLTKEESATTRDALHIDLQEGSKTTTSFEVLITEGDNGTAANTYRDRNWYFNIPCSENFSTGIDSINMKNDTLCIFEGDTTFSVIIASDTTDERIDSVTYKNDTLKIYEPNNQQNVVIATYVKAAGKVNADGTIAKAFNATVERDNKGDYTITFDEDMDDANYIIQLSQISRQGVGNDDPGITYYGQTVSGFKVEIGDNDNGGTDRADYDGEFMFTVIDF